MRKHKSRKGGPKQASAKQKPTQCKQAPKLRATTTQTAAPPMEKIAVTKITKNIEFSFSADIKYFSLEGDEVHILHNGVPNYVVKVTPNTPTTFEFRSSTAEPEYRVGRLFGDGGIKHIFNLSPEVDSINDSIWSFAVIGKHPTILNKTWSDQ